MKKWTLAIAPTILSMAALLAAYVFDNLSVTVGFIAVALLVAFALPSVIGAITQRASTVDVSVARVKLYRQERPDSTIMEAVHAADRGAQS
jgi:hypothetical protein